MGKNTPGSVLFNRMTWEGTTEKVRFERRLTGGEEAMGLSGEGCQAAGLTSAKALRLVFACVFTDQQGGLCG